MPHISRYKLTENQIEDLSRRMVHAASLAKNHTDLNLFFDDLLTRTEKVMLGKRFLIAFMLERDYSYFDIRRFLKVSDPTIATMSERLKRRGHGFRVVLKKLEQQEKLDSILKLFEDKISSLIPRMPKIAYRVGKKR